MTSPSLSPTRPRRRTGSIVVPHQPSWYQRLAAWMIFVLVRALSATLRLRWEDQLGGFGNIQGPVIFCTWHNRLALSMKAYLGYARPHHRTRGMAALVSASKDGAFLAAILQAFNVQPVRGSSSRRGAQALLELTTWAERGYDLAITPDGPRGPRYIVQEGAMALAQVTGLPIVPFSFFAHHKLQAKSWDRFQIPLPFSRCDMHVGKPIRVPREATEEERETLRCELEKALSDLSRD